MADFLSDEWLVELDVAAQAAPASTVDDALVVDALVVEALVTGAPAGDVTFHLEVTETGVRVRPGAAAAATVRIVTDHETATALHRGATNAQRALATGRLQAYGDLAALGRGAGVLAELGDLFGPARAQTAGGSLPA